MGRDLPCRDVYPSKREKLLRDIQPSRHVTFRSMVLTPASVPAFTIPGRHQTRRHTMPRSAHPSLLFRTLTRCCPFSKTDLRFMDDVDALSDPTTRAAMSLPHLSKITTPYGFVTLGESPCVRRRESLFFEESGKHASCLTTHGQKTSLAEVEKVVTASGEAAVQEQNYLESERSSHVPSASVGKRWLKCLLKKTLV